MKSVGEAMSIGRSCQESLQKGLRSLENDYSGLDQIRKNTLEELEKLLSEPVPERILIIAEAIRKGFSLKEIHHKTGWDFWFLEQISGIIEVENFLRKNGLIKNKEFLTNLKSMGFSDLKISELVNIDVSEITGLRKRYNILRLRMFNHS